jgi:hypothetical protein
MQVNDGDLFHYRDKSELEVNLIVRLRDGRWGEEYGLSPSDAWEIDSNYSAAELDKVRYSLNFYWKKSCRFDCGFVWASVNRAKA